MVGLGRVELPTSPLSGVRSNQLSYRPKARSQLAGYPAVAGARRLSKTSFVKRVSRTRLNALGSYAADDHRLMEDQAKKA
jgi:hypothetical protein